jgi:hypothetical protein
MSPRRYPPFTYIPTDIAPIACQYCGANAQVIQRSRLAADLDGEMRTFECENCGKQSKLIVRD